VLTAVLLPHSVRDGGRTGMRTRCGATITIDSRHQLFSTTHLIAIDDPRAAHGWNRRRNFQATACAVASRKNGTADGHCLRLAVILRRYGNKFNGEKSSWKCWTADGKIIANSKPIQRNGLNLPVEWSVGFKVSAQCRDVAPQAEENARLYALWCELVMVVGASHPGCHRAVAASAAMLDNAGETPACIFTAGTLRHYEGLTLRASFSARAGHVSAPAIISFCCPSEYSNCCVIGPLKLDFFSVSNELPV